MSDFCLKIRTCLKHSATTISISKLIIQLKSLLSSKHRDIHAEPFLFLHISDLQDNCCPLLSLPIKLSMKNSSTTGNFLDGASEDPAAEIIIENKIVDDIAISGESMRKIQMSFLPKLILPKILQNSTHKATKQF